MNTEMNGMEGILRVWLGEFQAPKIPLSFLKLR